MFEKAITEWLHTNSKKVIKNLLNAINKIVTLFKTYGHKLIWIYQDDFEIVLLQFGLLNYWMWTLKVLIIVNLCK